MNPELRKTSDAARCLPPAQPTILLVEDEPAVREVTREVLEMGGYRVLEAGSPDDACHIAEDQSAVIDLLLTDVVMPRMNGPELARQVSQLRPGLITIFMTGYTESEIPRPATRGALSNHIQKPFTIDGLLSRVGEALTARWRSSEDDNRPPQLSSP